MSVAGTALESPSADAACNSSGKSENLGVNINNLGWIYLRQPALIDAINQTGAGWIRINIYWSLTEPNAGQFNWPEIDQGLAALKANNINALVTLNGSVPCWALASAGEGCSRARWTAAPPNLWSDFVKTVVGRYSKQVHYWEIWNEPNLPSALDDSDIDQRMDDYRDKILIPGTAAVHAADPTAKVVASALAGCCVAAGADTPSNFARLLEDIFTPQAQQGVAVVSFHVSPPWDPTQYGQAARQQLDSIGMKGVPLWLTETTINASAVAGLPADRVGQEEYLQGAFLQAFNSGLYQKMFWFALTDSAGPDAPGGVRTHVNSAGLIDNQNYKTFTPWSPRPSLALFRNIAQSSCSRS